MTTQNVTYRSSVPYSCRCEEDADVVICVDSTLTASGAPYIEGVLASFAETADVCGNTTFAYYLEYDDADLATPSVLLTSTQVEGLVCKGCLTSFIEWRTRAAGKGASTSRPTIDRYIGMLYLDTTLDADGLPIFWNGSKWIKADGSDA